MSENSSYAHIVTLETAAIKERIPNRPKSAVDIAGKSKLSFRYGSAAVARNRSFTNGKESVKRPISSPARKKSADPAKLHQLPLILDLSVLTLTSKSSDQVHSSNAVEENNIKSSTNHSSNFPVGAHTSGYYSKLRNEQNRVGAKGASINVMSLMNSIVLPSKEIEIPIEEDAEHDQRRKSCGNSRQRATIVLPNNFDITQLIVVNEWKPEPDIDTIEDLLAQLSDADNTLLRVSESLSELVGLIEVETDPPMYLSLFNAGSLPLLLDIMNRFAGNVEIQVYACILVNFILNNCSEAYKAFIEMDGLRTLLKSSETSSKGYLTKKVNNFGFGTGKNSAIGSFSLSFLSSQKSSADSNRASIISIADDEKEKSFRSAPIKHTSLQFGALAPFFDEHFLDELDFIGSDKRKAAFSKLLSLYQKFDRSLSLMTSSSQTNNIENALDSILGGASQILGAQAVLLYKYDAATKELSVTGYEESEKFAAGIGIVGKCLEQHQLFCIQNPKMMPEFVQDIDYPFEGKLHTMMTLPIYYTDDSPAGVLVAYNKQTPPPHIENIHFDAEDEYLFKMIGTCCGTIMSNGSVYQSMNNTQKKVTVLLETTRSLASILELEKLIKVIMDSAKELLSSDRCTLFLHDPERKQLVFMVQGRYSLQEIRIPSNAGIAGAAFTSGTSINILDAYKDSRFNPEIDKQTGYVTKTILCMPIKNILGEAIGVTQMINKRAGVFTAEDEMILGSFCSQAAVAIEKSQLFKKTEDMRIYLQSILSSITSCVVTLSESMKLNTINRPWFADALGVDPSFMKENTADKWIGDLNSDLLKDIRQVYHTQEAVFVTDFEIKGKSSTLIVNYQVMPLIGSNGVVLVLDDISSEKRAVMTLGRYMSPALAKQVMEEGSGQLGGKRKKVSILFSDIRSFTTLSEGMDPPEVVELLNHHFTDAVNAITEEQGILDKFIGDAVMAVFGVPFASNEDAIKSCNSALRMRDSLVISNKNRQELGKMTIKIGIGVNTGMVLSGNIGSLKRMEFSCIGDAVNLASRVEGLTKFYGVQILITEFTLADAGDYFLTREVDNVIVTGKKNSVKIYELLGRKGDKLDFDFQESVRMYGMALHAYKKREFGIAAETFQSAIDITGDGPSKVLLERCRKYMDHPPPKDWKGDYLAEGK